MLSDEEVQLLHDGEAMFEMMQSRPWKLFMEMIDRAMEGKVSGMLAGTDSFTSYRELCAEHRALEEVKHLPWELVDRANETRERLDENDSHG